MAGQGNVLDRLEVRLRKLRFRSWHRGMREADLILGPFAETELATLTDAEIDQYERLLELSDTILLPWLTGERRVADAEIAPLIGRIRASRRADTLF